MRGEYSTRQRDAILSFLRENNAHVRASDIVFHLKEQGYKISTATVYRTLDKLVCDGVVRKIVVGDDVGACYQYLDGDNCAEHFHLKCIKCGRFIHLSCEFLHSVEEHIFKDHGFTVSSGKTVIYGTCAQCDNNVDTHKCHCKCHMTEG